MSAPKVIIKAVEPNQYSLFGFLRIYSNIPVLEKAKKILSESSIIVDSTPIAAREMNSFQNQHSVPVVFDVDIHSLVKYSPQQISFYTTNITRLHCDLPEGRCYNEVLHSPEKDWLCEYDASKRIRLSCGENPSNRDLPTYLVWWHLVLSEITRHYGSKQDYFNWLDQQSIDYPLAIPIIKKKQSREIFFKLARERGLLEDAVWSYVGDDHNPGQTLPGYSDDNEKVSHGITSLDYIARSNLNVSLETHVDAHEAVMFTEKIFKSMASASPTLALLWPEGYQRFRELGFHLEQHHEQENREDRIIDVVDHAERLRYQPLPRRWANVERLFDESQLVDQLVNCLRDVPNHL